MFKKILLLTCLCLAGLTGYSQVVTECPQNIGFENSLFTNWECYTGVVGGNRNPQIPTGEVSLTLSAPSFNRHKLIKRGSGTDTYGFFSLNAPNGSDYVVKLGNDNIGAEAESISYTLNVPSNVDAYSIIFSYAVVFENPPHEYDQQPRFTAKVFDVTTNSSTSCGSFDFVAPGAGGGLPGFAESSIHVRPNIPILCKSWSPVLVNLSDYLGHTIRLEFTTNDCTRGGHFGYAYIDFNENCSIPITGNVTCPDADAITLRTLPGFYQYNWYNADTEVLLGTADSLVLSPAPSVGTNIAVELVPYPGLGCTLILNTVITGIDMKIQDPPPECITKGVDLTDISLKVGNSSDLSYTYWRDDKATQLISDPKYITSSGIYFVKGLSSSGCFMIQQVMVTITQLPPIQVTQPAPVNYPNTVDITRTFTHEPGLTYSYWVNQDTTIQVKDPTRIRLGGTFYIKAASNEGCETMAPVVADVIITGIEIPNTFTPNGDGINDVFTVLVNSKIKIKSFRIYNRWGETVFITPDITNFWDGFKENTMMPVGVYYWVLEGDDNAQKRFLKSGNVTVLR